MFPIKNFVVRKWAESDTNFSDPIPLDSEIAEFIHEINKRQCIKTTNSCYGHGTYGGSPHPYLAFLVDGYGWNVFWGTILPEICSHTLIHIEIVNEGSKVSIVIRSHYDDREDFWLNVKREFLLHFDKAIPANRDYPVSE